MTENDGDGLFFGLEACDQRIAQRLALRPILFVIYTNDLDQNVENMVSKFADDIGIGGIVDNKDSYIRLQRDLDQLGQWAEEWQLEFNLDKYE
eukprot:g26510.t1